jgi:endonuclease/exonuclease/phosphatase (EEP) superfamily protein YafD
MHRVTSALIILLSIATFLPLIETNAWYVRYLDYPRLQVAVALLAVLALHLLASGRRPGHLALGGLALAALLYHGWKLRPFSGLHPPMAVTAVDCAPGSDLRVLVTNVLRTNERVEPFLDLVAAVDPDVILALETDAVWARAFDALDGYPHRVSHVPEDARFFGMHLLSSLPLVEPEVLFTFDTDTPSILTGITLPSGGTLRFHGLHPRPPHWFSQGTTLRDATLLAAGIEAAGSETPSILAGDLNAVPWEDAFRRTLRLGGLLDPRVGRGFLPTYSARSALMAWPLDHVLFQDELTLVGFDVLPGIDSDHYPVLAHLCHEPDAASRQSAPGPAPSDLEEAEDAFAAARRYSAD